MKARGFTILILVGLVLAGGVPYLDKAHAADAGGTLSVFENREHLEVALNQSRVIMLKTPATRVSVANPEIVDIVVLDPRQVYVVGKQLGTTNLVLWDDNDRVRGMLRLEVTHDLDLLKTKLHQLLPGERVQVRSSQGSIVVSGQVSSPSNAEAAVRLAESFAQATGGADKPTVLNMLQVGGSQQVMLEVKVAEITRTLTKRLDLQFSSLYDGGSVRIGKVGTGGAGFLPGVAANSAFPLAFPDTLVGPSVIQDQGLFLSSLSGNFLFNLFIDAAKDQGLAKILAEPNLTTLSGQQARFLAGGEFPIPVAQYGNTTTIEYKEFGVGVEFVPVVLDSGVISMTLNVLVSDVTRENAIELAAGTSDQIFYIPGLIKRTANSTVEVKSGETIAIAGLINETLRENVDKFPGLGELPVIGMLFRSQEFVKGQTELVIFVTPRLARSFDPTQVKLPTDSFVEPSDLEFYLMGRLKARPPEQRSGFGTETGMGPDKTGSEGHFGHDL
ncbi:type II and III secretion system protein family protein [Thiocapsa roseopersicina]|uniref:type II and III secretion system protein family protein n=1 Tax=Thiocapsa roseopersicina TaxID=1058 RepID=UPI001587D72E|nr:type II and III secretion system protein family protein [Thiocapsa roseopersicina]